MVTLESWKRYFEITLTFKIKKKRLKNGVFSERKIVSHFLEKKTTKTLINFLWLYSNMFNEKSKYITSHWNACINAWYYE